jgi:pilus assembly protein CpaE
LAKSIALIGAGGRQLEQLLRATGLTVVTWTEEELAEKSQQGSQATDIVMLDVREQTRLPASLEPFSRQHPSVPVVLLLSSFDPTIMIEAMRAGVKECLRDPVTAEDLAAAFVRIAASRAPGTAGDVFAFLGAKGGVGATTAAVNVATALSRLGLGSVLLVDLHLAHGDAAIFFAAEPRFSVADALENTQRLDTAFLKSLCVKTKAGPELLASPDRAMTLLVDAGRVRAVIEAAASHYRYVVLDLCRTDPAVLDGLDTVKKFVVIANQELATVRGASRMAATLNERYGKERVVLAVSRYDPGAGIDPDDIERVVGSKVRHLLPSDYRAAIEALNTGCPFAASNQNGLAGALRQLARALAEVPGVVLVPKRTKGFFARLTGGS